MKKEHRHRAVSNLDFGFTHCVNPGCCNPAAHGAVMTVAVCRCGWIREANRNGGRTEFGAWRAPKPGEYSGISK